MSSVILANVLSRELTSQNSVTIVSGLRLKYTLMDIRSNTVASITAKAAVWDCVEVNTVVICGAYLNAAKFFS